MTKTAAKARKSSPNPCSSDAHVGGRGHETKDDTYVSRAGFYSVMCALYLVAGYSEGLPTHRWSSLLAFAFFWRGSV
jgi:hypothetical protein